MANEGASEASDRVATILVAPPPSVSWQCLGYPQYDVATTQDGKTIFKVLVRVCKSKARMPQFVGTVSQG